MTRHEVTVALMRKVRRLVALGVPPNNLFESLLCIAAQVMIEGHGSRSFFVESAGAIFDAVDAKINARPAPAKPVNDVVVAVRAAQAAGLLGDPPDEGT